MLLGANPLLDGPVLLQDVIQVTSGFIRIDHPRLRVGAIRQRLAQQGLGGIRGTDRREKEIDRCSA
jgi:hypothetical protein